MQYALTHTHSQTQRQKVTHTLTHSYKTICALCHILLLFLSIILGVVIKYRKITQQQTKILHKQHLCSSMNDDDDDDDGDDDDDNDNSDEVVVVVVA